MKNNLSQIFKEVGNNYSTILETYKILEKTYEMGLLIHPAGQWLLDNMYIINQEYSDILEHKKNVINKRLPTIKTRDGLKHVSIYYIAYELIERNKGYTDQNYIADCLRHRQKISYLTSEELNLFPLMLRISIIKFISGICLNIANSQIQKMEVEKILSTNLKYYDTRKMTKIIYNDLKMFREDISNAEKLKQTNTSFVEYLASRLKGYGEGGEKYYTILNDEAEKIGFTVEEAIVKEHMEMARTTDYIGKAILGLKQLEGLNFREIFESVNKIDETLKQDYTKEFLKCDYKTKARYRNRVIKLSKRYGLSETYVAKRAVDCSIKYKKHVGFFFSGDERYLLEKELGKSYVTEIIRNKIVKPIKPYMYVFSILFIALLITLIAKDLFSTGNVVYNWIYYILTYIFAVEVAEKTISYIIRKTVPPKILPRFDFAKTIDKEYSTYITMPTVISSYEKIDTMIRKMEVTYLANRSENMYYMLLGDCISADKPVIEQDKKFFKYAKDKLDILNEKYKSEHKLFNFIYRKRVFSEPENSYMGWERKRGALKHFNELVLGTMTQKRIDETMYLAYDDIVNTKYCITIDEDTELSLNTAKDLVAIIAHPLNTPKLSKDGRVVKSGHGLIQPAVGLDVEAANRSIFSKIFGGFGGLDIYTTAVSNTYQDLFNEAIFCGKGIYDIALFEKLLSTEIPDNLVLSHDLLEGSYMRAGLASDIQVQDGFPNNYITYMKRNHRWYRGDMQIIKWFFSPKSPLNFLSRWKILDNIRRPMLDVFAIIMILISLFISEEKFVRAILVIFCTINFGHLLSLLDTLIFGKIKHTKEQLYIPIIHGVSATILTMTFDFLTLPYRAYTAINAFTLSLFRMFISKKHLLEWTTAEALEKSAKSKLIYYYYNMIPNFILPCIILYDVIFGKNILVVAQFKLFIAISFITAPILAYLLGKSHLFGRKKRLNKMQDNEVLEIAKRTWYFFDLMMSPVNNYLPTDNYQENRRYKLVNRTSSTNIGFGIVAIINAYDLKFIKLNDCLEKLNNVMGTVNKLEKWNGHLLNWYNIKTLEPLRPRFVSTVDSGNFLACVYILKEFLIEVKKSNEINKEKKELIDKLITDCSSIIEKTDFTKLYDMSRNLFSIGYAQDEGKLVDSYYDMLMSENRICSLLAIASKQVTSKHWFALSRNLIDVDGYKGLVSWSGTAFEYFMPYLFNKSYEHTLVDQSLFFAKYSQKKHVKSRGIPWGISESAFAVKDDYLNYQYQAFGIPRLGLKRGLKDYLVVSPYASLLMMEYAPDEVYKNIGKLKKIGAYGSYGFYESIDFTKAHLDNKDHEVVKTYMAHHQGMILTAINNYINSGIIKNRFHTNPNIEACEILLKERERIKANIKKDKILSDKAFKQKSLDKYTMYISNKISNKKEIIPNTDMQISMFKGKSLSTILTSSGASYLRYKEKIVNRQKFKDLYSSGNYIFLTDEYTGKTFSTSDTDILNDPDSYIEKTRFSSTLSSAEYYIECGDLESTTTVFLSPEYNLEVRKVSVYNNSNIKREVRINTYVEPGMTDYMTNIVHPSFNNLQIETYYDETLDILVASKRLKKDDDKEMYICSKLIGIDLNKDVETEKSKIDFSSSCAENAFDNKVTKYPLWPVLSFRTKIILTEHERQDFYYVVGVNDSKYKMSNAIVNLTQDSLEKQYKLACELNTVVSRYLKLIPGKAYAYNKIVRELFFDKKEANVKYWNTSLNQSMLWKFAISGDLPILLVNINNIESIGIADEVIDFMDYVKNRKIDIDIVIFVNKDKYSDKVYDYVKQQTTNAKYMDYTKGNVYLFNTDIMDEKDIDLFKFVCKKEISTIDPFLSSQQKPVETEEITKEEIIKEV